MYQPKKPRNFKSFWIISVCLIAIGIVLTINMAVIKPLGFALLGIGGFGMIWSLTNKKGWDDKDDPNNPKRFN
jgi:hypothetical protein